MTQSPNHKAWNDYTEQIVVFTYALQYEKMWVKLRRHERFDVNSKTFIKILTMFQTYSMNDYPPLDHNLTSLPTSKEMHSTRNLGKQFYKKYESWYGSIKLKFYFFERNAVIVFQIF